MGNASAPRRVLMTADTVGGVFTYAVELARGLARHGTRVLLATMGGPLLPSQRRALSTIPGLALAESRFRLEWMDDPWDDVAQSGAWLLDLARKTSPDIVHL